MRAKPEESVFVLADLAHKIVSHARISRPIEPLKPHPVKSRETLLPRHPDVPPAILKDIFRGIHGKSVASFKNPHSVLRDVPLGI
jgi:hypothetical protein